MGWYRTRYALLFPLRMVVYVCVAFISKVPGTTFGEVASMSKGPCHRCVGRALAELPRGHPE